MGLSDEQGCREVRVVHPKQDGKTKMFEERYAELRARIEKAERADLGGLGLLGERAATISHWLDSEIALSDQALTLCRVSKCANESGEALDALEKVLGINPRKGVCGSWTEVKKELLDVALTALGAYEHLSGERGDSGYALLEHALTRMARVGLSDKVEAVEPILVDEKAPLTEWVEALRPE